MFRIVIDDLRGEAITKLLQSHLQHLAAITPTGSMHALNLDALRQPEITFYSAWEGPELAGCGALKELGKDHAEIKSMRTAAAYLRNGVASRVLQYLMEEARRRKYRRLSLETGASELFAPAQALYRKFGFKNCGPFGSYRDDPNSVFMTLEL